MYVLVQHTISDPATFWNAADPNTISPKIKLQHTFPTPDGTRAVCIWEAESVDAVMDDLFEVWLFTPEKPAVPVAATMTRSAAAALVQARADTLAPMRRR